MFLEMSEKEKGDHSITLILSNKRNEGATLKVH